MRGKKVQQQRVTLENPTLPHLDNYLARIDPQGTATVYYYGAVRVLWDDQVHTFPGALEVGAIIPLDDVLELFIDEGDIVLGVIPIAPFTIEICPPGNGPSLPRAFIPAEQLWPGFIEAVTAAAAAAEGPEARTRRELIDPVLTARGWIDAMLVREESFRSVLDGSRRFVDYALYATLPRSPTPVLLAYLEAKHEGLPPEYGLEQVRLYAEGRRAQIRWVFATNGRAFVQYDRLTQQRSDPQPIDVFPTPADLCAQYVADQQIDSPVPTPQLTHRGRTTHGTDPFNADDARVVVESLLAPVDQRPCLRLMAELIRAAHAVRPGGWSLTLDKSGRYLRLNVGKIEVYAIFQNYLHLLLDAQTLDDDQRYATEQYAVVSDTPAYKSVPSSMFCDLLPEHVTTVLPHIRSSLLQLVDLAAHTVKKRTGYYTSHAPGLVTYVQEVTSVMLPQPIYT